MIDNTDDEAVQVAVLKATNFPELAPKSSDKGEEGSHLRDRSQTTGKGGTRSQLSSRHDSLRNMASQTDESKDESLPEIECDHCSRRFKANDRFYICAQCYNFDLCQACVLKADTLPEEHDLRCGLVDARDLRRTFVSGPSPSEFKTLIDNAKSDPNFKLPASAQNFLSRGATHGIFFFSGVLRLRDPPGLGKTPSNPTPGGDRRDDRGRNSS